MKHAKKEWKDRFHRHKDDESVISSLSTKLNEDNPKDSMNCSYLEKMLNRNNELSNEAKNCEKIIKHAIVLT